MWDGPFFKGSFSVRAPPGPKRVDRDYLSRPSVLGPFRWAQGSNPNNVISAGRTQHRALQLRSSFAGLGHATLTLRRDNPV